MGRSTINGIINEVCDELWNVLLEYAKPPTTINDWKIISDDFNELWNMPHCLGALMESMLVFVNRKCQDHFGTITKGSLAWFYWLFAMLDIVLVILM